MLSNKTGVFAINTATGNQAITGLGFTPKLVMFQTVPSLINDLSPANELDMSFGAMDGASQFYIGQNARYGTVTSLNNRFASNNHCIFAANAAGLTTPLYRANRVSLDADGFTVNVNTAPASGYRVGYHAIGGTDLTNVKIGNFASLGSTGNQSITGLGFQPDAIIFGTARTALAEANSTAIHWGLGMASGSPISQIGHGVYSRNGVTTGSTRKVLNDVYAIVGEDFTGGIWYANVTSFDADGFTINWATHPEIGRAHV